MTTKVVMPQMGESIVEGTITRWLKQPGERVEKDEPLFEISTDKVDAEIPAPVAGILTEIKVAAGATVQVNTIVAIVSESAANAIASEPSSPAPETTAPMPASSSPGIEVVMPQMGESIVEGTITKWLKQPGDRVEKDEPLFVISTDKVDAEVPAPEGGVLSQVRYSAGSTVAVNTVVAVIGGAVSGLPRSVQRPSPDPADAPPQTTPAAVEAPPVPAQGRRRSSPLVRRIAGENKIDLSQVPGTGVGGRIGKQDVLRYMAQRKTNAAQAAPDALIEKTEPLSKMRSIIAQRMVESMQISPHVHTVYRVDMTRIIRLRAREKTAFEQRHGTKLTFMPFVAAAAVEALRRHPILNASLEGDSIHYHGNVNLGIAVALDWGLLVPVVRQAESLDFAGLARAVGDLAERARTRKLMPNEVGGSTFTLTNAGIFGDEFSTPIINQPDAAILCISGLRKEPAVLTDAEGNDTIAIRSVQHYTLGFDHRLIDGADACKFMLDLKRILESWEKPVV